VQIGHAELFEVIDVRGELGDVIAEEVDVEHDANHLLGLKPVRVGNPLAIQLAHRRRTFEERVRHRPQHPLQCVVEVVLPTVEVVQEPEEPLPLSLQAIAELVPVEGVLLDLVGKTLFDLGQQASQ
jgi:hypothetical protein